MVAMFAPAPAESSSAAQYVLNRDATRRRVSDATLLVITLLLLWLGVYPSPVLEMVQHMVH